MTPYLLFIIFIGMIAGHFIAEFVLEPDAMRTGKFLENSPFKDIPWVYWMAGHSILHGLIVAHITKTPELGILEAAAHFTIDTIKCNNKKITFWQDQLMHLWCKMIWVTLLVNGWTW